MQHSAPFSASGPNLSVRRPSFSHHHARQLAVFASRRPKREGSISDDLPPSPVQASRQLRKAVAISKAFAVVNLSYLTRIEEQLDALLAAGYQVPQTNATTTSYSARAARTHPEAAAAAVAKEDPVQQEAIWRLQAALWTDEVRSAEAQRMMLQEQADSEQARHGEDSGRGMPDSAEFCPLSAELEVDPEVTAMRKNLFEAIREHADVLQRAETLQASTTAAAESGADPLAAGPAAGSSSAQTAQLALRWKQEAKRLEAYWGQLMSDISYLQVRTAQLRQLPAQPKRRITMTSAREQQVGWLFERQAILRQRTAELSAAAQGM